MIASLPLTVASRTMVQQSNICTDGNRNLLTPIDIGMSPQGQRSKRQQFSSVLGKVND